MSSKRTPEDIQDLFNTAHGDGELSAEGLQILSAEGLGAQIQAGLGVGVDDVAASEVLLVTVMPDDSGSIRASGNEAAVREGHNLVLEALAASKQREAILAHTRYLNGTVLFPYRPLENAVRMTATNYEATCGTPLYDQSVVVLGSVIAKVRELEDAGVTARSVTLLITDGDDQHSTHAKAKDVAALVRDIRRTETHIVAAMGIDDGQTDFREVFRAMGIDDRWILTPASDASAIRRAFQIFSQSAVRASQAARVSPGGLGGFVH